MTLAILLHELPQEMGDFGILLHAGFGRFQALALNLGVSLAAVVGGMVAVAVGHEVEAVHYLIPFNVGLFVYLALGGILPDLMRHVNDTRVGDSNNDSDNDRHSDGHGNTGKGAAGVDQPDDDTNLRRKSFSQLREDGHPHHAGLFGRLNAKQRKALRIVAWVCVGMGMMALLLLLPDEAHSHDH